MRVSLVGLAGGLAVVISACTTQTEPTAATSAPATASVAQATATPPVTAAAAPAASAVARTAVLADGVWTSGDDLGVRLEIRNGRPVSYSTASGFRPSRLSLSGNVFQIENATWTVTSASDTMASGPFRLAGRTNTLTLRRQN